MNPPALIIRRATVDDLPALKAIWLSMQLPTEPLENRLTDFQVVERAGEVVGAIGFQIVRTAALLYGEGYSDFSVADAARELFWDRAQKLAANLGVFRLWTLEDSPFWRQVFARDPRTIPALYPPRKNLSSLLHKAGRRCGRFENQLRRRLRHRVRRPENP